MCVAGELVEVQVRVKCVADLARWKLVMVGATVYIEEKQKSFQYAYLYFTACHYILIVVAIQLN